MKQFFILALLLSSITVKLSAQNTALGCPNVVSVVVLTAPSTCASTDGSFIVVVGNRGANPAIVTIDGFVHSQQDNNAVGDAFDQAGGLVVNAPGGVTFNGRAAGVYTISIKSGTTSGICQTITYNLTTAPYKAGFANTPSANTNAVCGTTPNGSILLSGLAATDSVSWLASTTPVFTVVSAIPAATISNLAAGTYYVMAKDASNCSQVSTTTIVVGGPAPCIATLAPAARGAAAPQYCDNAESPNNLWNNGTFGVNSVGLGSAVSDFKAPNAGSCGGGIVLDPTGVYNSTQTGGVLTAPNSTSFGMQPLGAAGPTDGFYAITDNINDGLAPGGCPAVGNHNVFDGLTNNSTGWNDGYDQDWFLLGGGSNSGGFQMVVNGGSVPAIAIQQTIGGLCPDENYQFSIWVRSLYEGAAGSLYTSHPAGNVSPNLTFLINGVAVETTGDIPNASHIINGANYTQYGFNFKPNAASVTLAVRSNNSATDGQSNAFAIDDIYVGKPTPTIAYITPACPTVPTVVSANVTDACNDVSLNSFVTYQWKQNGVLVGASLTGTLVANAYTASSSTALVTGDVYQLVLAPNAADLSATACLYTTASSLTVTSSCIILPIRLVSITAQQLNANSGEVNWQVGDQLNVNHYELYKSTDGVNFTIYVGSVNGSDNINAYSITDDDLYPDGVNYYRLKEVDNDGTVHYSSIVTINPAPNTSNNIEIYPNPVADELYISKPQNTVIKGALIIDAIGQTLMEVNSFNNITNSIQLNNLPTGFYELKVIDSKNQVTNLKFIKK